MVVLLYHCIQAINFTTSPLTFYFMPYVIALVVIIVGGLAVYLLQDSSEIKTINKAPVQVTDELIPVAATTSQPAPTASTDTPAIVENVYKDGTYKTQVTYLTPKRDEYLLDVSLTIQKDIVTGANVVYSQGAEIDPNPQRFEAAYKDEIIGKPLDAINLSRVGGASLTTAAFNKALASIKTDAEA
jgi:hypothetical protein